MKTTLAILTLLTISLPTAVVAINTGKASTALPLPMSFVDIGTKTAGLGQR